jgi:hypothetical protein
VRTASARSLRLRQRLGERGGFGQQRRGDGDGFHLPLHSRARGFVDPVQPEHAVVFAAGQLLTDPVNVVLTARGHADPIKVHHGITGTRDDVHAAAVVVTYPACAHTLVLPAQPELREEPVLVQISGGRPINAQLDRSDELVGVSCQVGAVIGAREASERVGSSSNRHRKYQQESSERGLGHRLADDRAKFARTPNAKHLESSACGYPYTMATIRRDDSTAARL